MNYVDTHAGLRDAFSTYTNSNKIVLTLDKQLSSKLNRGRDMKKKKKEPSSCSKSNRLRAHEHPKRKRK